MEKFKDALALRGITIVNPVWNNIKKEKIIGWHLIAPSQLRMPTTLKYINKLIKDNELNWYVEELEFTNQFFVYVESV